jgi:hypothetical protein
MRPPEQPTEFVLESLDDKVQMVVSAGKDYESVAGYLVTLRYGPDNRLHRDKRVNDFVGRGELQNRCDHRDPALRSRPRTGCGPPSHRASSAPQTP